MSAQATPKRDRAASVIVPPIRSTASWEVSAVKPLDGYRLDVEFNDGTKGMVDMRQMVHAADSGVFAALRDQALFDQAFIRYGAVTWPGDLDLAPDAMYDKIKAAGKWVIS